MRNKIFGLIWLLAFTSSALSQERNIGMGQSGGGGLTLGSTAITGVTDGYHFYNNGGVIGQSIIHYNDVLGTLNFGLSTAGTQKFEFNHTENPIRIRLTSGTPGTTQGLTIETGETGGNRRAAFGDKDGSRNFGYGIGGSIDNDFAWDAGGALSLDFSNADFYLDASASSMRFDGVSGQGGPQSTTLAAAVATFAVTRNWVILTGDGGGNSITTITAPLSVQMIIIEFVDANVTFVNDDTHAADTIDLIGSSNITGADDTILWIGRNGTSWYQMAPVATN